MRLAFALGRTVRELEASMGKDEWDDWLDFHNEYDLPDGFHVAAQLGRMIAEAVGNKNPNVAKISPYFTMDSPPIKPAAKTSGPFKPGGLAGAFSMLRSYVKPKRKPE